MLFARIYFPLALGYAISYFYRNANAIIEGDLVRELGLGPADLGLLTSVYFISFAAFQLPLGVLLGPLRSAPHRVHPAFIRRVGGMDIFSVRFTFGINCRKAADRFRSFRMFDGCF